MRHGAWQETGGGPVLTAGGAIGVAALVIAYADRHQIEQAAGEAIAIGFAVVAVVVVAVVSAAVILGRWNRRQAAAFEERSAVRAAEREAEKLDRRERAALEAHRQALTAPVIVQNIITPDLLAGLLNSRQAAPVVVPAITEEADR